MRSIIEKKDLVKKETWEYLSQKAYNTYVPETTVSRNSGAGAGLLDND